MKHTTKGGTKKFFTLLFSFVLIASPMVAQSAVAADYPPSIKNPVVGKPLCVASSVKVNGATVIIPTATAPEIPLIVGEPLSFKTLATKLFNNKSVEQSPVKLSTSLLVGGIGSNEKAPTATISASKKSEVQIPIDVPSRITVTGLKPAATGKAFLIDATGRTIDLGTIKVDKNGNVFVPAFTFVRGSVGYIVNLVINGKTTTFTIHSITCS